MATIAGGRMSSNMPIDNNPEMNSFLLSKFPIWQGEYQELHLSDDEFKSFIQSILSPTNPAPIKHSRSNPQGEANKKEPVSRFIQKLREHSSSVRTKWSLSAENKTLTGNGDLAFISSGQALTDFFYKFGNTQDSNTLKQLLDDAWNVDARLTLKLIFQLRSIHVGKGEKMPFYKAMAWLYEWHPKTFLMNLPWIARPVIEKKKSLEAQEKEKKEKEDQLGVIVMDEDEDFEMVNPATAYNTCDLDEPHGHAHGYWKDLLNMLVLAVDGKFNFTDSGSVFNVKQVDNRKREWDAEKAKAIRQAIQDERFKNFERKMSDPKYRAFHAAVARLFASQLTIDLALSKDGKAGEISLAAKWAPSPKEFHDKHTFIVTSIAEIMFPHEIICPDVSKDDRVTYLKMARMAYRFQALSPLRKALDIVERHLTAKTYSDIKYEKVPSVAMSKYTNLFKKNDQFHFRQYLSEVHQGKSKISGAILLPAQLVIRALQLNIHNGRNNKFKKFDTRKNSASKKEEDEDEDKMLNAQWNTIVERVKRSGKLSSSIAVCDVSGSMTGPAQRDGTTPMDSAIGLSLLLSEVTEAPFGGNLITFSKKPSFISAGGSKDKRSFAEKVHHIRQAPWGSSTNFVAVFEKLILPMAISNKLKQEEMVKQVFVFSDMQFNAAQNNYSGDNMRSDRWTSSYERIKRQFKKSGYDMPQIVFWNLAGKDGGVPVAADEPGTTLISGYSQAQMKIFLDEGGFEDGPIEEDEDNVEMTEVKKKPVQQTQSFNIVKKATSHKAFAMLKVYD